MVKAVKIRIMLILVISSSSVIVSINHNGDANIKSLVVITVIIKTIMIM